MQIIVLIPLTPYKFNFDKKRVEDLHARFHIHTICLTRSMRHSSIRYCPQHSWSLPSTRLIRTDCFVPLATLSYLCLASFRTLRYSLPAAVWTVVHNISVSGGMLKKDFDNSNFRKNRTPLHSERGYSVVMEPEHYDANCPYRNKIHGSFKMFPE
jgi:hypothetical protein